MISKFIQGVRGRDQHAGGEGRVAGCAGLFALLGQAELAAQQDPVLARVTGLTRGARLGAGTGLGGASSPAS